MLLVGWFELIVGFNVKDFCVEIFLVDKATKRKSLLAEVWEFCDTDYKKSSSVLTPDG